MYYISKEKNNSLEKDLEKIYKYILNINDVYMFIRFVDICKNIKPYFFVYLFIFYFYVKLNK